jgi:hypothetical protein
MRHLTGRGEAKPDFTGISSSLPLTEFVASLDRLAFHCTQE